MGKFMLEFALFAGILCQIHLLTSRYNKEESPQPVTIASIESLYKNNNSSSYSMSAYELAPHVSNETILQELARKEAERIIRTGDYESFQKRLQDNKVLLNLSGYGL